MYFEVIESRCIFQEDEFVEQRTACFSQIPNEMYSFDALTECFDRAVGKKKKEKTT